MRSAPLLVVALVLATTTGCGGTTPPPTRTADNGDRVNAVDVRFANDMVVHHAQALQLANLLRERSTSAEVASLGERIFLDQPPQTETFVNWLSDWGEDIPETPLDHANGDDDHGGTLTLTGDEMPGLLSTKEVEELKRLSGEEFDRLWVRLMRKQQQGGVEMAGAELEQGVFPAARNLAKVIASQHEATVAKLDELATQID